MHMLSRTRVCSSHRERKMPLISSIHKVFCQYMPNIINTGSIDCPGSFSMLFFMLRQCLLTQTFDLSQWLSHKETQTHKQQQCRENRGCRLGWELHSSNLYKSKGRRVILSFLFCRRGHEVQELPAVPTLTQEMGSRGWR